MELIAHYRDINTIGFSEGLGKLRSIYHAYKTMKRELTQGGYDVFIPVDYPDVNIRLALFAKRAGLKVCYYISPQVWAWRKGRIRKIARRIDHMMTLFPFEEKMYRDIGAPANFVGHTLERDTPAIEDKPRLRQDLGLAPDPFTIGLVPGSRPAELARMLPVMCAAGLMHAAEFPETRFALPLAGAHLRDQALGHIRESGLDVTVLDAGAAEVMAACDAGLVTSGTATLQAALAMMPHAIVYKLDAFTWFLALRIMKPLLMDKDLHVGIANVLALRAEWEAESPLAWYREQGIRISCLECGRPLFVPEFLQEDATPESLARQLRSFRTDTKLVSTMKQGFRWLRRSLAAPEDMSPARIVMKTVESARQSKTGE
jgi:lipid-A-disaccharide synthase